MYKSTLQKLFCLDGLIIDKCESLDDGINLYVRSPRTHALCARCGMSTKRVHRKDYRSIKHMMHDDKIVSLKLRVRNFKCKQCGFVFREKVPGIGRKNTTVHFRQTAVKKISDRSFSSVAREYRVSPSSLTRSAVEISSNIGLRWPNEKFSLGLDGHSFSGREMAATLTNLTHHNLIGILPDYKQDTLAQLLQNMPETSKKLVSSVCIDMHEGSRAVIEKYLPKASIVVDKFHVVQLLNKNLEQLRNIYTTRACAIPKKLLERNKEDLSESEIIILKNVFLRYPPINDMWRLKEWFRVFYLGKDPKQARAGLNAVIDGIAYEARPRWQVLYRTLRRWKEYILNYFDHRITNAYTEGVHTRIKLLKRVSYGFRNRQNYIAKMTLAFLPVSILINYIHLSPSLT